MAGAAGSAWANTVAGAASASSRTTAVAAAVLNCFKDDVVTIALLFFYPDGQHSTTRDPLPGPRHRRRVDVHATDVCGRCGRAATCRPSGRCECPLRPSHPGRT